MSAQFIIEYGGCPVRMGTGQTLLTTERSADRFTSEAEAWMAAHRAGLVPERVQVVNLYERNQMAQTPGEVARPTS